MSSAGAASEKKMIVLKSSDGKTFEVEEAVALESQTIKQMIENNCADTSIPLPDVTSKIMAKVIEYCKRHVDSAAKSSSDGTLPDEVIVADLKLFDAEFVKVDRRTLIDLTMAAWHLNIKSLLDLTCQGVADMMTGMTPEEIRTTLNIKKDLSREEEEEICRMHAWAFQRRKTFQRRKRRFAG